MRWTAVAGVSVAGAAALLAYRQYLRATSLERCLNLDDLQKAARLLLRRPLYEYLASGTGDEQTLQENIAAWKRYFLRPRMMRDVSDISTNASLLGESMSMPVFISPAGVHRLCDFNEGECASARAADAAGTLFGLSQHSTCDIESVAHAMPHGLRYFQLYLLRDRDASLQLVRRAEVAGYRGFFLTVDSVVLGSREADARNGFSALPPPLRLANYGMSDAEWNRSSADRVNAAWDQNTERLFSMSATWEDLTWLKSVTRLPVIVKGIMTAEDATLCLDAGADGVYVSNHGGRQVSPHAGLRTPPLRP